MKLTFLGAAHEVTGSCTLLEACGKKILVDCGMEQGPNTFENRELPVPASDVDCVLLTHAHIDHSGNLPLLAKNGFAGSIYCSPATAQLCGIMLRDCAYIQTVEAEWKSRKAKRAGKPPVDPVFDMNDAEAAIGLLAPVEYGAVTAVCDGVSARFNDAGHLLGSANIEIWINENGTARKLVFSGDVGNTDQPLIKDPEKVREADYAVIESTYGNRLHGGRPDYIAVMARYIQETFDKGGNVVIPSFAVGRTQEVLFFIRKIKQDGLVKGHDGFEVYVDSPLANEATRIFMSCERSCFDDETNAIIDSGVNPISFPGLRISVTSDDSRAINFDPRPKVIISASGMCEAGRIRHHLKHNLWRPECTVLFVGYQAEGTLGRALYDGAKKIRIFGEEIAVNARIEVLEGISGHADKNGLIDWLSGFERKPAQVFVNHGDSESCESFAECLRSEYGYNAQAPYSGAEYDLAAGIFTNMPAGVPAEKKYRGGSPVFDRLLGAMARLNAAVRKSSGYSNKEIEKTIKKVSAITESLEKR